jgi:membrane protein DedA with SNARE-associated domain/FAD/FMN-containing dehydrogenase
MKPAPLVAAALTAAALAGRWQRLPARIRALGVAAVLALATWGSGVIHPPHLETIARDIGATLGWYTYVLVGLMALLETGAGIGLIAPGELAVIIGGVTAGQGHTDLVLLIPIVWACAFTGDLTSYTLGRRLGRSFLLRHGHLVKLTPARLGQVESFLARHGGKTIIVGRFIGLVRALTPFVAGSSRMPARRFVPATFVAAGIWSAAFSVLGYLFWQSFDQAADIAKRGTFALLALVVATVVLIVAYRTLRARPSRRIWVAPPISEPPRVRLDRSPRTWCGSTPILAKEDTMTRVAIDQLRADFVGELVRPNDAEYESLRRVFNGMVDRRPGLIARCTSATDVVAAVNHGRENGLALAVHGGGHGVAGHAVCDDGLMVDLRPMKQIEVDWDRRTARVQAGLTWGELDAATQVRGLAVTGGRMSTTGISGLTLGSGSGWLERKYGLTADNLLSAEVVLADGSLVTASELEHADLFWALRGGSGNFGIVTTFEFQLHEVGPIVLGGVLLHPGESAGDVLRFFRDFMSQAPDEVGAGAALITAPPEPFVPEAARGKRAVAIIVCYAADVDQGERVLSPLREFGSPVVDLVQPMPYTAVQQLIDPSLPKGLRQYWGGDFLSDLSDEAIDGFCAAAAATPSPFSQILMIPGGGQIARTDDDAMAIGGRQAPWNTHLLSVWTDPAHDRLNIVWLRELKAASAPYTTGRAWLNFLTEEGEQRVRRALGDEKYERLQRIKDRYDPENLFQLNQNIRPSRLVQAA